MENQGTNKSKIVNGKILDFANTVLKERMRKQQDTIEEKIAVLMSENKKYEKWFNEIVQSKPNFPQGVMRYEDIMSKKNNNGVSLAEFLDEKIREEYQNKIREEYENKIEDLNTKNNSQISAENFGLIEQIAKFKEQLDAQQRKFDDAMEDKEQAERKLREKLQKMKDDDRNTIEAAAADQLKIREAATAEIDAAKREAGQRAIEIEELNQLIETNKELLNANNIRTLQLQNQLTQKTDENEKCKSDLAAIQQQLPMIDKLKEKLTNIYKQHIINKAKDTLRIMNKKPLTPIQSIQLTDTNRAAAAKILKMIGGSGITMKGGAIINFSYDDNIASLQNLNPNDINILTNAEITIIENGIKGLQERIRVLESNPVTSSPNIVASSPNPVTSSPNPVTSSPNLKLLIQKLLITKAAHAQNYKTMLFEKITNGVNKQIIAAQAPAIEQLKTANKGLDVTNKGLDAANKGLETANKGLDAANKGLDVTNKELETKNAKLEKDLVDAKNASTVLTKSTAAIKAAKLKMEGMYKDNNVIYYKTSPPIAMA